MTALSCPHCRAEVQAETSCYRCPACGIRFKLEILPDSRTAVKQSRLVAEIPTASAITTPELAVPLSYLERLLRRILLWRRRAAVPLKHDDKSVSKISRLRLILIMVPWIVCGISVVVLPVVGCIAIDPELLRMPDLDTNAVFTLFPSLAVSTFLMGLWTWLRIRRLRRDVARARILQRKNACCK
jgi:hypothetical protein